MTYAIHPPQLEAIFGDNTLSPSKKLLLLVLQSHASGPGQGVYPSLRRLASYSGLSLAHVCTLLPELEASGHLAIQHRQGPKGGNVYVLTLSTVPVTGAPSTGAVPVAGTHQAGAPLAGTELNTEREKALILFQTPEHQSVVLQPVVHPTTVNEAGAHWLRHQSGIDPHHDFYGALAGTPPSEPETTLEPPTPPAEWSTIELETPPTDPANADTPVIDITQRTPRKPRTRNAPGTAPLKLGKLCPRGHEHEETGMSLRRVPSGSCDLCERERQRERDRAKNPNPRAHKPYNWQRPPATARVILAPGEAPRQREHRAHALHVAQQGAKHE
jgi:hypothetical protein